MSGSPGALAAAQLSCVRGAMLSAKWPDWRVAFVWGLTIAIATAIYFLPMMRLLESLAE